MASWDLKMMRTPRATTKLKINVVLAYLFTNLQATHSICKFVYIAAAAYYPPHPPPPPPALTLISKWLFAPNWRCWCCLAVEACKWFFAVKFAKRRQWSKVNCLVGLQLSISISISIRFVYICFKLHGLGRVHNVVLPTTPSASNLFGYCFYSDSAAAGDKMRGIVLPTQSKQHKAHNRLFMFKSMCMCVQKQHKIEI